VHEGHEGWDEYAPFYDWENARTLGRRDVPFWRTVALNAGGTLLELGAGTGRIAIPLARAGFEVTGLDRAPGMLAIARDKLRAEPIQGLRFIRGNMTRFSLPQRFGLVLIAFRSFQHLLTVREQRACLEHVRRHLRPKGRLIVNLFDPRLDLCVPDATAISTMRSTVHDQATGQDVSVDVTDRRNDPLTQTFSERWRWTVSRRGRVRRRCDDVLCLRWTYRHEMRHLFELTGYRVVAEYSDFRRSPPRYGAEQIWVVTPA
jgi:ubiquinone/menaquinone biosynthesis C-methylase UbiE